MDLGHETQLDSSGVHETLSTLLFTPPGALHEVDPPDVNFMDAGLHRQFGDPRPTDTFKNHDSNMAKRQYTRRTDEQMIAELEEKISSIKGRIEIKQRKDSPVVKKWNRVQKTLQAFAQLAMDHDRADVANSVTAFAAGTNRLVEEPPKAPKKKRVQEKQVEVDALES